MIRKIGVAVVGTALLAAAMWLKQIEPRVLSHDTQPLRNSGRIGQSVSNSAFALRVDRVDLARSIQPGGSSVGSRTISTDGVFVIVHLQAKATRKPYEMGNVRLESGGYTFTGSGRTGLDDSGDETFQPMIWRKVVVSFEIPKNRLAGARLVVGEGGLLTQLTAETAVDLGFTPAKASDLIAHAVEGYHPEGSG